MAGNASVTNTFTQGLASQATQVNTNFNDLVVFINGQLVHLDGSKAMTGALTLPGVPTQPNHAATKAYVDASIPAGIVNAFAGASAPAGWLLCQGQAVSRATYAALFAAVGTTYGAGDGSTTFNLPDYRGRTLIGAGTGTGLTNRTLGGNVGTETHVLTVAQMPSHNHAAAASHQHNVTGFTSTDGLHAHGDINGGNALLWVDPAPTLLVDVFDGGGQYGFGTASTNNNGNHFHSVTGQTDFVDPGGTSFNGSGLAHPIMQPSTGVNWIIKF